MKYGYLVLSLFLFVTATAEAQWYCWGERYCWGCRRYMNLTIATYDDYPFGYVDIINYPDMYRMPLNRYFDYCPPCRRSVYNYNYLQKCIYFTNRKNGGLPPPY